MSEKEFRLFDSMIIQFFANMEYFTECSRQSRPPDFFYRGLGEIQLSGHQAWLVSLPNYVEEKYYNWLLISLRINIFIILKINKAI